MAEKNLPKLSSGQIVKWKEQDYPTVYSNLMGFGMTPFDLAIVFGEVGDATPEQVTGIPRVKVLLTPEQASNLVKLLSLALNSYVENNGQIRSAGAANVEQFTGQLAANKVRATKQ